MAGKKLIYVLLMAAVVFSFAGLAGCSQGEEIEISLSQTTSPQLAGQIYIGGAVNYTNNFRHCVFLHMQPTLYC